MNIFILDGTRMLDRSEAHRYIARILRLPEYYGENLDALYDCLTEICESSIIRVEAMMPRETAFYQKLIRVMQDAADENSRLELRIARGYYVEG